MPDEYAFRNFIDRMQGSHELADITGKNPVEFLYVNPHVRLASAGLSMTPTIAQLFAVSF